MKVTHRDEPPKEYTGPTDTTVAVRIFGFDQNGNLDMQLNLVAPETGEGEPIATSAQILGVQQTFPQVPATISSGQAHALLCYRDYARAVVDEVIPNVRAERRDVWIQIIATLVSHDDRISKDVRRWSERRFAQASGDPRIKTTKHFLDLTQVCEQIAEETGL